MTIMGQSFLRFFNPEVLVKNLKNQKVMQHGYFLNGYVKLAMAMSNYNN